MDAIVTAGAVSSPDDPLYVATGVARKALIPLAGKPMVRWVVEALHGARHINHIVVVGLAEGEVDFGAIPVLYTPSRGSILENVLAGVEMLQTINPDVRKFVLSSSDIPLITSTMVDEFIDDCLRTDADVFYTVVEEKTMERRFPGSNRSFIPLKGGRYAGGDFFLIDVHAATMNLELFRKLSESRKNYWGQLVQLGPVFVIKFLLRQLSLAEAAQRAGKILGVRAAAVDTPHAELGMDVDKPHQYELIKAELEALRA